MDWVRNRLTTRFQFPSLLWLFGWLAAYILIAGVGNFMLLRWADKREWGWVTLPSLAVVFAFGMYFSSASNRPREFRVEDVTFYWMDENSPVAAVERGERISAPHRQALKFSMNDNVILAGDRNGTGFAISVNPFGNGSDEQLMNHWEVKTGRPVEVAMRMLQWSFRDLEFYGTQQRPGTILRTAAGHLRNDTGKNFSQALYVDKNTVFTLGAVAAGADINLGGANQKPLEKVLGKRLLAAFGYPTALAETSQIEEMDVAQQMAATETTDSSNPVQDSKDLATKPFDLTELIRGWPPHGGRVFDSRSAIFFGMADEPDPPVSLSAAPFGRKSYSITVVSFERKP